MRLRTRPLHEWPLCAWPDVLRQGGPRLLLMSPRGRAQLHSELHRYGVQAMAFEDEAVVAVCGWPWFGDPLRPLLEDGALCFALDRAEFVQAVIVQREAVPNGPRPPPPLGRPFHVHLRPDP